MSNRLRTTVRCLAGKSAALLMLSSTPVWAEGDAAKGEKVYKKCKSCHSLEAGKNKIGPHLDGVIGRTAGAVEGFKYSLAMADSGLVWDEAALDSFLAKPKELVPKTKWRFRA